MLISKNWKCGVVTGDEEVLSRDIETEARVGAPHHHNLAIALERERVTEGVVGE
jgi:hypothetical protein